MGRKHKHSKDKLYSTVSELKSHYSDETARGLELSNLHRRLKFNYCCLSLNAVSHKPVGVCDGDDQYCYVFEADLIVKFLEKYQSKHPITGKKISTKDLVELKFHKNSEQQYHCPVIYKLFNQNSKIVANKKSGHVYSYEAYQKLCLKPNNFKDLLTDEPFSKSDIVTIQDPELAETKWNVSEFYYVKNKLRIDDDEDGRELVGTVGSKIRETAQSDIIKTSLEESKSRADSIAKLTAKIVGGENDDETTRKQTRLDQINSAIYSDGALSSCVTSTVAPVISSQKAALLGNDQILYPRIKKKGYLQLVTNFGPLNLELYCDRTPKTCHNFFLLASRGYYDNTCFHRLIKNFIIQGGDPTGTGKGGQSAWNEPFKDECHGDLKHVGRGVVAMANSGPNSNKSQFYITLKGVWDHLDGKHTVFGRVVGGEETLERIESVEVDEHDRPKKEIKIMQVVKYVDPYEEAEAAIAEERKAKAEEIQIGKGAATKEQPLKRFRTGVGAYIDPNLLQRTGKLNGAGQLKKIDEHKQVDSSVSGAECAQSSAGMTTSSLSEKLAVVSNSKMKQAKSQGDFSNW